MGGKKGNKSKKSKTKAQKAAAKRHANFKKTLAKTGKRVQTFGGTKKKYTKAEARAIEKAHGGAAGFAKVTGGAANPLNRAPSTEGVKYGDLMQPVEDFSKNLGLDYSQFAAPQVNYDFNKRPPSDFSFSDVIGARFNEAGRNEVNQNVAQNQGPSTPVKNYGGNMGFERDFGAGRIKNVRPKPGFNLQDVYGPPTKTAMLSGDNMGGPAAILGGVLTIGGMGVNAFKNMKDNFAPKLRENIEKKLNPEDVSSTGIGNYSNLIAAADPTALSGLGIGAPKATGFTPTIGGLAESLGLDPRTGQEVDTTAGGLNIGGNFGLSAEESDRLGRVFNAPTNNKMLSEGGNLRMSDMFEADTQGAKIAKGINFVKNKIPLVNKLPDMKINSVAEEAQRQYLGYNPNLPASALARMDKKGKGGGTKLPLTPTIAQEVAPQYQPVPSESTTPTTQTGVDPNRLLQIQQQAYAQAYNPMLIGGFNPQFRFGAATPTIDYSTYFNY